MKIAILCDGEDRALAGTVLRQLKTSNFPTEGYTVGAKWRIDRVRLDEVLASATHLVAVYTVHSVASAWLAFLAGYSIGTNRPLILYRPSRYPSQASFLAPFFLVLSADDLVAFLEAERKEWFQVSERREARRSLLELGISFRGESFAEMVQEGNSHAVELFLKAGLPADTRDKKGTPLLGIAARSGNRAMVDLLLDAGASVNLQSEDRGNTALMDAAAAGNEGLAKDLLRAGAAPNLKSKDEQTALVIAVGRNDTAFAALLLRFGADPDIPDKLGFSARKYAVLFHNSEMISLFDSLPRNAS